MAPFTALFITALVGTAAALPGAGSARSAKLQARQTRQQQQEVSNLMHDLQPTIEVEIATILANKGASGRSGVPAPEEFERILAEIRPAVEAQVDAVIVTRDIDEHFFDREDGVGRAQQGRGLITTTVVTTLAGIVTNVVSDWFTSD